MEVRAGCNLGLAAGSGRQCLQSRAAARWAVGGGDGGASLQVVDEVVVEVRVLVREAKWLLKYPCAGLAQI